MQQIRTFFIFVLGVERIIWRCFRKKNIESWYSFVFSKKSFFYICVFFGHEVVGSFGRFQVERRFLIEFLKNMSFFEVAANFWTPLFVGVVSFGTFRAIAKSSFAWDFDSSEKMTDQKKNLSQKYRTVQKFMNPTQNTLAENIYIFWIRKEAKQQKQRTQNIIIICVFEKNC
jgi:hypothetical protein